MSAALEMRSLLLEQLKLRRLAKLKAKLAAAPQRRKRMLIVNPYAGLTPVHDTTLTSWIYLGTTDSIYDDTPGGLDDLLMIYNANYQPMFGQSTVKPVPYFELLRCWGRTNYPHNYKIVQWTGLTPVAYTFDPFFADLIIRARECGYPL